jgi:uncharacterized protein
MYKAGYSVAMLEIPPLPDGTILLVEVGSTAHGTGIPGGEDHDELAVVVELPGHVLGLAETGFRSAMQRAQPEGVRSGPGDTDRTIHSLRRFLRLAASGWTASWRRWPATARSRRDRTARRWRRGR